jgi:hypothetical protein
MARDSDRKGSGRKKDKLTVTMVTPPFRMAFPALFTPEETDNGERYKVTALFPPDANLKKLKSALNECMVDAFGEPDDWPTGRNDVHPDDKLYDAGTKEYNGFKKGWTALSIASTDAPGIVDADGEEVLNKREVYGGRWARAHVAVTSYDNKSKGVTVYLNHVQLLEHDTPFSGKGDAKSAFDKYELQDSPYSGLVLVKADELHEFAKADMDLFDNLPPELRKEYRERTTNIPVNPEDMERAEQNRELAAFGFGRAG